MRILYVEDDPNDADLARRQLRKTVPHFELEVVSSQHEALARLSGLDVSHYDLVLTDMRLHDGDGLAILTHIRARGLPLAVVLITGAGDEETAVAVLKAGANDYIVKRGDYLERLPLTLEDALNHYRSEAVRRIRPLQVLYAEHNAADIDLLERHLAAHASHIHIDTVSTAVEALQHLPEHGHVSDYDIILLDYRLPGLNALEMLKELYQVRSLDVPVVLVTGQGDDEVALQALKLGASDYIPKNPGYIYQLPSVLENTFHRARLVRDQAALRESEERFRRLAENAQDVIFRYCFTPTRGIEYISPAIITTLGYTPEAFYADPDLVFKLVHPDDRHLLDGLIQGDRASQVPIVLRWIRKDGTLVWSEQRNVLIYDEVGNLRAIEGIVRDITERMRAEEELRHSEAQLSNAMKIAQLGYWEYDVAEDMFTFNDHFYAIFRTSAEQVGGYRIPSARYSELFLYPDDRPIVAGEIQKALETTDPHFSRQFEHRIIYADGKLGYISVRFFIVKDNQGRTIKTFGANQDVTERKLAEEQIQNYIKHMETLLEIERAISSSLDLDDVLDSLMTELTKVVFCDLLSVQILEKDSLKILTCRGFTHPDEMLGLTFPLDQKSPSQHVIETRKATAIEDMHRDYPDLQSGEKPSSLGKIRSWLGVPLIVKGLVIGMLTLDRYEVRSFSEDDIQMTSAVAGQAALTIENARLFSEAQRRSERLSILHRIDKAIVSSLDLQVTLDIILGQVLEQLKIDAAAVLIYRPELQTLEFAAGQGFRIRLLKNFSFRLGQGFAGKVALERQMIRVSDINQLQTGFLRSLDFISEGFVTYIGVPLLTKGLITGVMELYHRQPLDPDPEWLAFLETMAGQAAIAIDNLNLFYGLQKLNLEIVKAYDETIEGWAQALEMRDMETEGHSRRVVDMTLTLARELGIGGSELAHIRRGALLHDIGKMGVPDAILQKCGELTTEEWDIMRKHPLFALEWLSKIEYLRPALDIPYCHHEKWDGLGYPRGLRGEEIPLAARIFAIADVFDALMSDRIYRNAWSQSQVLKYIQDQSGKQFDPKIVEVFLNIQH